MRYRKKHLLRDRETRDGPHGLRESNIERLSKPRAHSPNAPPARRQPLGEIVHMRGRVRTAIGLIGVVGVAVAAGAQAQAFQCAALKPSSSRAPAYGGVTGQSRCEGFFEKTVSQPFIELLSLTRGAPPSASASAGAASVPLELRADVRAAARLVVQPLPSSPFYRVDAALPSGQALSWDAAPMLAATRQPLSRLGFLALVASASASPDALPALAPVAFTPQALQEGRVVYAVVRVSVDVASVAWRGYRVGSDAAAASANSAWTDLPDSHLYAWKHITLTIPMPADGKGLRVDVQAVGAANAQSLPLLRFAIVGPSDGP